METGCFDLPPARARTMGRYYNTETIALLLIVLPAKHGPLDELHARDAGCSGGFAYAKSGTTHVFTWESAIPRLTEHGSRELLVAVD